MSKVIFVTGNAHKAKYFSDLVGRNIAHKTVDVPEIQSLSLEEVVTAKVRAAYAILKAPVIVEDTSLVIHAMGTLPGTFIKWFLEELKPEGLCRLADGDKTRTATASACFAYYDGISVVLFIGSQKGTISLTPQGTSGFGWNTVFIPEGSKVTLGEMNEKRFKEEYIKIKPFEAVKKLLDNLDKV